MKREMCSDSPCGPHSELWQGPPATVSGLRSPIRTVVCGLNHTLALDSSRQLFAWGCGRNGKLGVGDCHDRRVPTKVVLELPSGDAIKTVSAGVCPAALRLHL